MDKLNGVKDAAVEFAGGAFYNNIDVDWK